MIRGALMFLTLIGITAPAQAEIIDRACMLRHLCAMASPCISQEQAITVRIDTTLGTVQFGLNGRASELALQTDEDGLMVARSQRSAPAENALLSLFPDGTLVYTVHLINQSGTGLGLSVLGTCDVLEDG